MIFSPVAPLTPRSFLLLVFFPPFIGNEFFPRFFPATCSAFSDFFLQGSAPCAELTPRLRVNATFVSLFSLYSSDFLFSPPLTDLPASTMCPDLDNWACCHFLKSSPPPPPPSSETCLVPLFLLPLTRATLFPNLPGWPAGLALLGDSSPPPHFPLLPSGWETALFPRVRHNRSPFFSFTARRLSCLHPPSFLVHSRCKKRSVFSSLFLGPFRSPSYLAVKFFPARDTSPTRLPPWTTIMLSHAGRSPPSPFNAMNHCLLLFFFPGLDGPRLFSIPTNFSRPLLEEDFLSFFLPREISLEVGPVSFRLFDGPSFFTIEDIACLFASARGARPPLGHSSAVLFTFHTRYSFFRGGSPPLPLLSG